MNENKSFGTDSTSLAKCAHFPVIWPSKGKIREEWALFRVWNLCNLPRKKYLRKENLWLGHYASLLNFYPDWTNWCGENVVAKIGHSDRINKLISKRLRTILLKQIYFLHEEFERMLHWFCTKVQEQTQSSKKSGFWDIGSRTLILKSSDIFG